VVRIKSLPAAILLLLAPVLLESAPQQVQEAGTGQTESARPARQSRRPQANRKVWAPPPAPQPEPILLPPPPQLVISVQTNHIPSLAERNESLLGRSGESLPPAPISVLRAIIGFVALLVLAYLGGHPQVRQLERQLNIAHVMTTGLPFLLIGLIASQPSLGILTPTVLGEIGPLLPLGLGWIGFVVGSRFDAREIDQLPDGLSTAVFLITAIPLVCLFAACAMAILLADPQLTTSDVIRDALLLGTAGAMAARSAPHFLRFFSPEHKVSQRLVRLIEFEQLAGIFGVMMVSAYYRPTGTLVAWHLPGTAWLFITIGIGTTMGVVLYAVLTRINKDPQFTAVLLGTVAFTAGMASFLRLSPLAVCFIAGAIVINIGGAWKQQVREVFERLERPVYFLFMVIAGALWRPWEWQGWVLMAVFVTARVGSKWLSSELLRRFWAGGLSPAERWTLTGAPMGALSIAIVVSAQELYFGTTIAWIVTAVIGGSLITEVVLQVAARRKLRPSAESPVETAAYERTVSSEVD
jgi:Kef-type K+ transport system membrane component KefB